MKAIYTAPANEAACALCYDSFSDCDCVACAKARTDIVRIINLGVGLNCDRANIMYENGELKNVSVDTLRVLPE